MQPADEEADLRARVLGAERARRAGGAELLDVVEDCGELLLRAPVVRAAGDAQLLGRHADELLVELVDGHLNLAG